MHRPIERFKTVWRAAQNQGSSRHRNAVCVSTIDADGYPNARFVDLKDAEETGFVFCTHLDSAKAQDIDRCPKTGITLWWEHVATQVRIKGSCTRLTEEEADGYWLGRLRDARIATATFQQSRPLVSLQSLAEQYERAVAAFDGEPIPRPENWGGFRLRADYIEFLEFKESRLHERITYSRVGSHWEQAFLQP